MTSVTWYYFGGYTQGIPGTNANTGFPDTASYNPYNNPSTVPFVTNPTVITDSIVVPYGTDNIDRTSYAATNVQTTETNQGYAMFIAGGLGAYRDTIGVALTQSPLTDPSQATTRYILLPNSHATPNGTAPSNPYTVTGGFTLPVPSSIITNPVVVETDPNGVPIISYSDSSYYDNTSATTVYINFFLLSNAWMDGPSGPYVDTTAPIRWIPTFGGTTAVQARQTFLNYTASIVLNANLTESAIMSITGVGFEDLDASVPPFPDFANSDFNDVVFVLAPIVFSPALKPLLFAASGIRSIDSADDKNPSPDSQPQSISARSEEIPTKAPQQSFQFPRAPSLMMPRAPSFQ